jgi:hypothetical protein
MFTITEGDQTSFHRSIPSRKPESPLNIAAVVNGKARRGNAKARTESGKSRCSGSQGGLRKREHDGSRIEAQWETIG